LYILFKIESAQVELTLSENNFLEIVDKDLQKVIDLFNKSELSSVEYKVRPSTVAEAKWLINAYCTLTRLNQPLPKWLLDYFNQSFESLLDGTAPANALGLTKPPHRPKESYIAERDNKIYLDVINLMQNGTTLLNASFELSEKYNLHESTIQKIYASIKKSKTPESDIDGDGDGRVYHNFDGLDDIIPF
jgi:hypothetical protein